MTWPAIRCMGETHSHDLRTTVLGTPVLGSPDGSGAGREQPDVPPAGGARSAARAAKLRTHAGCCLEDVGRRDRGTCVVPGLSQCRVSDVRVRGERGRRTVRLLATSWPTMREPMTGLRERDVRNSELLTRRPILAYVWQFLAQPGMARQAFVRDGGLMEFSEREAGRDGPMSYTDVGAALEQSTGHVARSALDQGGCRS